MPFYRGSRPGCVGSWVDFAPAFGHRWNRRDDDVTGVEDPDQGAPMEACRSMRSLAISALVLAGGLTSRPPEGHAQQQGPAAGARRGYYSRVQTNPGIATTSGNG